MLWTRCASRSSELLPCRRQSDLDGGLEVLPRGHEGAERAARSALDLQRTDDPAASLEPAGRDGVDGLEPGRSGAGPLRRPVRFEPAADVRIGARELQDVQGGADVEPGAAGQDGAFPRAWMSAIMARACCWKSETLASSVTSRMSSRWCGTPAFGGR